MSMGDLSKSIRSIDELVSAIELLQEEHDLATRVEDQLQQVRTLQNFKKHLFTRFKQKASELCLKNAYDEAIRLYEKVKYHIGNDERESLSIELNEIRQLKEGFLRNQELVAILARFPKLHHVLSDLSKELQSSRGNDSLLHKQINYFLLGEKIDFEGFLNWWNAAQQSKNLDMYEINLSKIAERVRSGEMALFLGSGITHNAKNNKEIVDDLALKIGYENFSGSLSSIAEYYKLRPDFGTSALLSSLNRKLESHHYSVSFYKVLASLEQPIIIISAAYDRLLEQEFLSKGKPFVEIYSIIKKYENYDIGHTVVRYSDKEAQSNIYLEEEISCLDFLEANYSIIYKICGVCDNSNVKYDYLQHTSLTITENDYFKFARYIEQVIPSYLIKHLLLRGLLFVGFRPRNWEERLLANALLKRRRLADRPYYIMDEAPEPLEKVYWEQNNIKPYNINLSDFEEALINTCK